MARRFETMTSAEIGALAARADAVVVLPFAATEQHGPHLPVGTDAIIADGMVEEVLAECDAEAPIAFLEPMRVGTSAEHGGFAGTLSLSHGTAATMLRQIGRSLGDSGFRRLVVVSSHGGNTPAIDAAALELRTGFGLFVATASFMRFGFPEGLLPQEEVAVGIHAGAAETALMMHFRPDLVREEAIDDFPSLQTQLAGEGQYLRAHGRLGYAWMACDLNGQGAVGDARLATPAMGAAIAGHQARGFRDFLGEVARFDLARLGPMCPETH